MSLHLTAVIAWFATATLLGLAQGLQAPSDAWPGFVQAVRSEAELLAVLESKPSDLQPYLELAHLYYRAGRIDDGVEVLRRALGVHPQTSAVFAAMVGLYGGPGNMDHQDKMASVAEEWVKADATNTVPLVLLAQVHLSRAMQSRERRDDALIHLDRAKQMIDDALRVSPNRLTPHALRLSIAKQQLDLTEDPTERERLQRELDVETKEFTRLMSSKGAGESSVDLSATSGAPWPPNAVRVGGNIKTPTKIKDVKPVYPADALQARVQGVVIFEIMIDEAGKVAEGRVLRSIPLLDRAAEEAVRQWEFTPTLLNGNPVPVIMIVTVQFTLTPAQ